MDVDSTGFRGDVIAFSHLDRSREPSERHVLRIEVWLVVAQEELNALARLVRTLIDGICAWKCFPVSLSALPRFLCVVRIHSSADAQSEKRKC